MKRTHPGEIWWIDFGVVAKVRPALILSEFPADNELALLTVIPHTTAIRGHKWEIEVQKSFLKSPGAFHLQQLQSVSVARLEFKLGVLSDAEFHQIKSTLASLLKLGV